MILHRAAHMSVLAYTKGVEKFSQNLLNLLGRKKRITIGDLIDHFAESSFAVMFLLLMALPALPLPTGGITHIFEVIVMLLSLELIGGRKKVWLPKRWLGRAIPLALQTTALPKFTKIIQSVERFSRSRFPKLLNNRWSIRLIGVLIFIFTLSAFVAPPFSGLDTLPAIGVVLLSLSLIFRDSLLALAGIAAGFAGIMLIVIFGSIVLKLL